MRSLSLLLCAAFLAGCTHARTLMLDDRHAIISGRGNAFVGQADVLQTTLVEAANATLAHGYRYFAILGSQDTSRAGAFVTPTQTYTNGNVNLYGNSASYSGTTTTTGGNVIPFVKPGMDVEIYMYREGEVRAGHGIWDAQAILSSQPKERAFP